MEWDAELAAFLAERVRRAEQVEHELAPRAAADPDRPRYHLAPPVGRLNDPNGLIRRQGRYHAFYQYSPLHPEKAVFWRHAVSEDLLHWQDRGTALAPEHWYDRSGCYSGSAVSRLDGGVDFYYTGNVKDSAGNRETYQCRAVAQPPVVGCSEDLTPLQVDLRNPLLAGPPAGYTAHVRDPQVIRRPGGSLLMLLGAQREDRTGAVLRLDSEDGGQSWHLAGELRFDRPELQGLGYMWECPHLLTLVDEVTGQRRDVLLFCPQGVPSEAERFRNAHPCCAVVGRLDGVDFLESGPVQEVDAGFEFYAPQTFAETGDRSILLGWMGNAGEDDQPSGAQGWVHQMTLPRELSLREGRLVQRPVPEVDRLLPLQPLDASLSPEGLFCLIPPQERPRHRLRVDLAFEEAAEGAVRLLYRDARGIAVTVELRSTAVMVDRSGSRYQAGGPVRSRTLPAASRRRVEIFADSSSLEIFTEEGACVFTQRIFLQGPVQVQAQCDVGARLLSVQRALLESSVNEGM